MTLRSLLLRWLLRSSSYPPPARNVVHEEGVSITMLKNTQELSPKACLY